MEARPRRINPTRLAGKERETGSSAATNGFGVLERPQQAPVAPFLDPGPPESAPLTHFDRERDLMRLERLKPPPATPAALTKPPPPPPPAPAPAVRPQPGSVTHGERLRFLSEVYSALMDANLVLNLSTEVCFLMSLIVVQDYVKPSTKPDNEPTTPMTTSRPTNSASSILTDKPVASLSNLPRSSESENRTVAANVFPPIVPDNDKSAIPTKVATSTNSDHDRGTTARSVSPTPCTNTDSEHDTIPTGLTASTESENNRNAILTTLTVPLESGVKSEREDRTIRESVAAPLLDSVHNCVRFACSTLDANRGLLTLCDRASLKLLAENPRVADFAPALWSHLVTLHASSRDRGVAVGGGGAANVTFLHETDNRTSFPSEAAFYAFKKQRDGFYEILQAWEKNRLLPDWSFSSALGGRVRALVGLHAEPANHIHFARLFRCQLVRSCCSPLHLADEDCLDSDTVQLLRSLRDENPAKYLRLRERLVTPQRSSGGDQADFPGPQEFYREFISAANSAQFHSHLVDSLASEILTLSDTNFAASELDDRVASVDEVTRSSYVSCVSSLRLLAKFLGYIVFLPYRSPTRLTADLIHTHAGMRAKISPPLDVLGCLRRSLANHQLVVTVPWVVKYLSMIDAVSISLAYYNSVVETLFNIYLNIGALQTYNNGDYRLPPNTVRLITLSLGWLFESPSFPDGLYFAWCCGQDLGQRPPLYPPSPSPPCGPDRLELVDMPTLHCLCPHLTRVTSVLCAGTEGSTRTTRHVTPAQLNPPPSPQQQLELALEESFFHGQSSSLRQTVSFVSDRVASCCIKHAATVLVGLRGEAGGQLAALIKHNAMERHEDCAAYKDRLTRLASQLAASCAADCVARITADAGQLCRDRVRVALPALLPADTPAEGGGVCGQIAERQAVGKLRTWLGSRVTLGVFLKDFTPELDRACLRPCRAEPSVQHEEKTCHVVPPKTSHVVQPKTSHVVQPGTRLVQHSDSAMSPPVAISALRDCVFSVRDASRCRVTLASVLLVLDAVRGTVSCREDLIPTAELVLHTLLMDLVLALVAYRPALVCPALLSVLTPLWHTPELRLCSGDVSRLFSARNMMLLAQWRDPAQPAALHCLLDALVSQGLASAGQLAEQAVAVRGRAEGWPALAGVVSMVEFCIECVVREHSGRNGNVPE